jgi:hypothetical protein
MNTIATFDEQVEALRRLSPLKYRLLALIVEAMLREAQQLQRGEHHG